MTVYNRFDINMLEVDPISSIGDYSKYDLGNPLLSTSAPSLELQECLREIYLLTQIIVEDNVDFGFETNAEKFIRYNLASKGEHYIVALLNKIFMDNFRNLHIVSVILYIISHMNYTSIYPYGQTMVLAALNLGDPEIQEYCIRCFELWENPDGVRILEGLDIKQSWLRSYRDEVICDLKKR